jgi:cyclophilin family peptidyl-prolyl cis-trans isomerase
MKKPFAVLFLITIWFLYASCQRPSPFDDKISRAILTLADERKAGELLELAESAEEPHQVLIARSFAALQDSLAIPVLTNWLLNGKSEQLRAASAFSLGQYRSRSAVAGLLQAIRAESDADVKKHIARAIGKCGQEQWLVQYDLNPEDPLAEAFAEALFYARCSGPSIDRLLKLAAGGSEKTIFFALLALATYPQPLDAYVPQFEQLAKRDNAIAFTGPLLKCLVNSGPGAIVLIEQLYTKGGVPEKIMALNAISNNPRQKLAFLIKKAISDPHPMLRETAANCLQKQPEVLASVEIRNLLQHEKWPPVKFALMETWIRQSGTKTKDSLSQQLKAAIKVEKDPYTVGYQCNALSASWENIGFLEELMFNTPDILIRQFAFEAILKIRTDKRFPESARFWTSAHPGAVSLQDHIGSIIRSACETMDVSLLAIASVAMRDTTLPLPASKNLPIGYASLDFLENALKNLKLPRDIETYGEVLKTLRFYQGKPVSGTLKPEFNNPVDWDLVLRIPENQKVIIETDSGNIELELWPEKAPATCAWFIKLVKDGFYNQKRVHRVVPGFVTQDGCPRGDGYGSLMETIRSEFHEDAEFLPGTLGMASAGQDTESCQWFITHAAAPHLNGRYTAFGKVVHGLELAYRITRGTNIRSIRLLD